MVSDARNKAIDYLKRWLLKPYFWGGDDFAGMDCSGLVIEVLQSVGVLPDPYDNTADGLWNRFKTKEVEIGYKGCLVFWFNEDGEADHVAMMEDVESIINASGGGKTTTTIEEAMIRNAFVKPRPLDYRGNQYKIVDPFMSD